MIDLAPLLAGARGDELVVAGVRVGDDVARVDRSQVTASEGDFVRLGEIALRVKDGVIDRIVVRRPALGALGIAREADIARCFGPAEGHERSYGKRYHHYPARRLVVVWNDRDGHLDHLALGETDWTEPRLGARELLAELLAGFDALAAEEWTEPSRGSARVRYQRVDALARALDVGPIASLVDGSFLDRARSPARRAVLDEIAAHGPSSDPVRDDSAGVVFVQLLHYRRDVEKVVRATDGCLLCNDAVLHGLIAIQDAIGAQLATLVADVDRWLCALIDPAGRTIELRDLIAHQGWPDVDLGQLEMDEL